MKKVWLAVILILICSVVFATQDPQSPIKNKQISLDGKMIGYLAKDYQGVWQLFVKNKDGSNLRQITFFAPEESVSNLGDGVKGFVWSPDSSRIVCSVFYYDTSGTAYAVEAGYNELTLIVIDLFDLTARFIGGRGMRDDNRSIDLYGGQRTTGNRWIDISQLKWHTEDTQTLPWNRCIWISMMIWILIEN